MRVNILSIISPARDNIARFAIIWCLKPLMNTGFTPKSSYERDELIDCGYGRMFGPGNAKLPIGNMLMLDRITEITDQGGEHADLYLAG